MRVADNFHNVYAMKVYNKTQLKNLIRGEQSEHEKEIPDGGAVPQNEYTPFWLPAYEELDALRRISKHEDNPFLPHLRCAFEDENNYCMVMVSSRQSTVRNVLYSTHIDFVSRVPL